MDYSKLSDFEINKRVAELQPYTCVVGDGKYPSISDNAVYVERRAFKYGNIEECGVDYCNNPSDAWPLLLTLIENGCTVIIDNKSVNGDSSAKTIERKIAELYLSLGVN